MRATTVLTFSVLLTLGVFGCDKAEGEGKAGSDDAKTADGEAKAGDAEAAEAGAAGGALFGEDMKTKPCEMLTAKMAAEVLGADAGSLTQSSVMKDMCSYATSGEEDSSVTISFITVKDDIAEATTFFDNAYKGMSGEEVAEAMKQLETATKEKLAEDAKAGDAKAASAQDKVEPVTGALGGAFKDGFSYEDVPGVGDAARLALTKREIAGRTFQDNDIHVRVRNMYFNLSIEKGDPAEHRRDELVQLAKLVTAAL